MYATRRGAGRGGGHAQSHTTVSASVASESSRLGSLSLAAPAAREGAPRDTCPTATVRERQRAAVYGRCSAAAHATRRAASAAQARTQDDRCLVGVTPPRGAARARNRGRPRSTCVFSARPRATARMLLARKIPFKERAGAGACGRGTARRRACELLEAVFVLCACSGTEEVGALCAKGGGAHICFGSSFGSRAAGRIEEGTSSGARPVCRLAAPRAHWDTGARVGEDLHSSTGSTWTTGTRVQRAQWRPKDGGCTYTFPRTCVLLTTKVNNSLFRSPATPSLHAQPPLVCLTHLTEGDGRARCCGVVVASFCCCCVGCREFRRAPIRGGSKGPLTEWYLCVLRFEPALLLVLHPKSGGATQQRARTCTIIAQKQLSLLKSANVSAPCCVVVKGYHFLNAVDSSLYRTCCRSGGSPVTVGGGPTVVCWQRSHRTERIAGTTGACVMMRDLARSFWV